MARLLAALLALALAAPAWAQTEAKKPTKAKKSAKAKSQGSASAGQSAPAPAAKPAPAGTDLGMEAEREEARIRRKSLDSARADSSGE
jgi:hypothetical protein